MITRAKQNILRNKEYTIFYKQVESKLQGAQTCTERFCQHCVTHTDSLSRTWAKRDRDRQWAHTPPTQNCPASGSILGDMSHLSKNRDIHGQKIQ